MNFYYYTTYRSNIQALEKIFIYFSKIISSLWLQHSLYSSLLSHRVVGKIKTERSTLCSHLMLIFSFKNCKTCVLSKDKVIAVRGKAVNVGQIALVYLMLCSLFGT